MKQTEFNALVSVETRADALLLANGTNFLFNETTVDQEVMVVDMDNMLVLNH